MKIRFLLDPEFWNSKLAELIGYKTKDMWRVRSSMPNGCLHRVQDLSKADGYKLRTVLDKESLTAGLPDSAYKECWKAGVAPDEEYNEFPSDLRFDFERYVRQFAKEQGLIQKEEAPKT